MSAIKPDVFIPVGVFLAVSTPLVWLLNALEIGGEFRVWLAIGAGALATGYAQSRLAAKAARAADAAAATAVSGPAPKKEEHA